VLSRFILIRVLTFLTTVSLLNIGYLCAAADQDLTGVRLTASLSSATVTNSHKTVSGVENHFKNIISKIDSTLFSEQKKLKKDQQHLHQFVNANILPYWNIELTLKQLLGRKNWKQFSQNDINSLEIGFNNTLHRYVQEGIGFYDGQRVKFLSAKLNDKNTRGIITIRLEPIYLPAFNIIFKIAQNNNKWLLYDILVEGISYVKMKKNEYRQIVNTKGVEGLLSYLDEKNTVVKTTTAVKTTNVVTTASHINTGQMPGNQNQKP